MRLEHLLSGEDLIEGFWYYEVRIDKIEKDEAESKQTRLNLVL